MTTRELGPKGGRYMNPNAERIYDFILQYVRENGYAPAIRNISEGVGLSPTTVFFYLHRLEGEGHIKRSNGKIQIVHLLRRAGEKEPENSRGYIYKLDEENVDGCGGSAYVYACFTQELDEDMTEQLHQDLSYVKTKESDKWDCTDDIVHLALERFQAQTGIACYVCDSPLSGIIAF